MSTTTSAADQLSEILLHDDVKGSLWAAVDNGVFDTLLPEFMLLQMEQDPIHKHKDVLTHTIAVVAKTPPDLTLRLATLFHDIGKPKTRSFETGGVTFRHHEVVGARMARKRMEKMGYDEAIIDDVYELVRLSGRFKGYTDGWSDSAVRRYARDAGPLLGRLNDLVRCDCTTRNKVKAQTIQDAVDDLERRIGELAEADRVAAIRPDMSGDEIMEYLSLEPGPLVGKAVKHLLAIRHAEGPLPREEVEARLDAWWADNQPG